MLRRQIVRSALPECQRAVGELSLCVSFMLRRIAILVLATCCLAAAFWAWRSFGPAHEEVAFEGLDAAKQKEIWDAEHVTFEIETYVSKPLVEALIDGDDDKVGSFLLPDFSGSAPDDVPDRDQISESGIEEESLVAVDVSESLDGSEFLSRLYAGIDVMESLQSGRLRVLKINHEESNPNQWNLNVLLHLRGEDGASRSIEYESTGTMQVRFQDDAEIREGTVIGRWDIAHQSLRGADEPLFEELTEQLGLDQFAIQDNWKSTLEFVRQYLAQHAVGDFDGDGDLDLATATADGTAFVLRRDGDRFVDVSAEVGLLPEEYPELRSYLAHWIDVDSDGFIDLLLGSRLYRNLAGERFEPFADNAGLRVAFNPMGVTIADYDVDGHPDLYILYQRKRDQHRAQTPKWVGDDESGAENQLWRNLGNGRFKNVTQEAGASGGARHSFAAVWHHANDDLLPDMYVANDFGANSFFINRGDGRFDDASESTGVADFATSMGVAAGDINDDGRPEIYVANMFSKMGRRIIAQVGPEDYPTGVYNEMLGSCAGNRLYSQRDGVYSELSETLGINEVGWAYAPAFLDVDGDGDLDIYATSGFMSFDRRKPDG